MDGTATKDESHILQPGMDIKPDINLSEMETLVSTEYGLQGVTVKELDGYDDRNYFIKPQSSHNKYIPQIYKDGYVFKIMNSLDSVNIELVEAQNQIMLFACSKDIATTLPVKNLKGEYFKIQVLPIRDDEKEKKNHIIRLLEFQPGSTLKHLPMSYSFMYKAGKYLANLDETLKSFYHKVYDTHRSIWLLDSFPNVRPFVSALENSDKIKFVEQILKKFSEEVLTRLDELEKGMIHGDFNEYNIIVNKEGGDLEITAILDWGDANNSYYLFELAIGTCYMVWESVKSALDPLESSGHFIAGYNSVRPISDVEMSFLKTCICARFCQSLVMSAYSHKLQPENRYIIENQISGWPIVMRIWNTTDKKAQEIWKTIIHSYNINNSM